MNSKNKLTDSWVAFTEAMKRVGGSAQDAGVSFKELAALVAVSQRYAAREGSTIGNSLKTIFTRIHRFEVLEQLDALGVKTRNSKGGVLSAATILCNLAEVYKTLNRPKRIQIAELIGGLYQINILRAILTDLSQESPFYFSVQAIF